MKNFADWNKETTRMVIFTDVAPEKLRGFKLPIWITGIGDFQIKFSCKVDLDTLDVYYQEDELYDAVPFPTLNELSLNGIIEEWTPYRLCDVDDRNILYSDNGELNAESIRNYLNDNGFDLSLDTIYEIYELWKQGHIIGRRDEIREHHIFCPEKPYAFMLRVTELHPACEKWQQTYIG